MHIATNVLREVTRNLGAKTKEGFRSRWRIAVSTITAHHVHAHAHAGVLSGPNRSALQVQTGLVSRSQKVCSPRPNRSALQVPTRLLSRSQPVASPGPNRCRHVSSPGPKRSHLQCLRLLVVARHHRQQLLCLLLCFSGLGVALHRLPLHALILQLQLPDRFLLFVQPGLVFACPVRSSEAAWSAGQSVSLPCSWRRQTSPLPLAKGRNLSGSHSSAVSGSPCNAVPPRQA